MAPALLAFSARIFTFALPRIPAMRASDPGALSQEIVSCLTLGTGEPPHAEFAQSYQSLLLRTTKLDCERMTGKREVTGLLPVCRQYTWNVRGANGPILRRTRCEFIYRR